MPAVLDPDSYFFFRTHCVFNQYRPVFPPVFSYGRSIIEISISEDSINAELARIDDAFSALSLDSQVSAEFATDLLKHPARSRDIGERLWDWACSGVHKQQLDDRHLYWQRLAITRHVLDRIDAAALERVLTAEGVPPVTGTLCVSVHTPVPPLAAV